MGWPLGGQRLKPRMVGLSGGSVSPLWEIRYIVPVGGGWIVPRWEETSHKKAWSLQPASNGISFCVFTCKFLRAHTSCGP